MAGKVLEYLDKLYDNNNGGCIILLLNIIENEANWSKIINNLSHRTSLIKCYNLW